MSCKGTFLLRFYYFYFELGDRSDIEFPEEPLTIEHWRLALAFLGCAAASFLELTRCSTCCSASGEGLPKALAEVCSSNVRRSGLSDLGHQLKLKPDCAWCLFLASSDAC